MLRIAITPADMGLTNPSAIATAMAAQQPSVTSKIRYHGNSLRFKNAHLAKRRNLNGGGWYVPRCLQYIKHAGITPVQEHPGHAPLH